MFLVIFFVWHLQSSVHTVHEVKRCQRDAAPVPVIYARAERTSQVCEKWPGGVFTSLFPFCHRTFK